MGQYLTRSSSPKYTGSAMHLSPTAKEDVGFHSTSTCAVLGKQVMVKDEGMLVVISCLTICDVVGTVSGAGRAVNFFGVLFSVMYDIEVCSLTCFMM